MKNKVKLDLDQLNQELELLPTGSIKRLYGRFAVVIDPSQKCIRVGSDRIKYERVLYALQNQVSNFGYLFTDDDGQLVELDDHTAMLLAYSNYDKVMKKGNRYVARWIEPNGNRRSKLFGSYSEALNHQQQMFDKYHKSKLEELNIYQTYSKSSRKHT